MVMIVNPLFVTVHRQGSRMTYNPIYDCPVCTICFEPAREPARQKRHQCPTCKHFAHVKCLKTWKKKSKKFTCPTCRCKVKLKYK